MRWIVLVAAAATLLAGCKADDVEIRVSTNNIRDAIQGDDVSVRFIARYSAFGEMDGEKKAQLDQIQSIVEGAMQIDDYNVTTASSRIAITVEGEVPVVFGEPGSSKSALALYVWEVENALLPNFPYAMQLNTGAAFKDLKASMQDVSYTFALDDVQPVQYRIHANSGQGLNVLAGGGQIDGVNFVVRGITIDDGERMNFAFKGGAYDAVYGGLLIGPLE